MLDNNITKMIEDFVAQQPRSVLEIAQLINKSWHTADRYVEEISKEFGTISTRTFREGTKGALKIVYWSSMEKKSKSVFRECLENQILARTKKEDFCSFDIFQHIPEDKKKAYIRSAVQEDFEDFSEIIKNTKKQLLIFSGNLSFTNLRKKEEDFLAIFKQLMEKGVNIKILTRVDIAGWENVEKILSLNFQAGKEAIEIRHREQPLRAFLSDNKVVRIKEVKEPTGKIHELGKKIFIFYTISDQEWVSWLSQLFWRMFSSSVDAEKRIKEIKKLQEVKN